MPVKKTTTQKSVPTAPPVADMSMPKSATTPCTAGHDFAKKILLTLVGVLLAYACVYLGTLIRNNLRQYYFIGQADKMQRTIRVEATGKITARPDIAMTTIGMVAEGKTVLEAQQQNTAVMNGLIDSLKKMEIAAEDIQTANYNIYPRYQYSPDGSRDLTGYEVSQSVTVKIRDLTKANDVLALAGESGANSVSGLDFTIDDKEVYMAQAREKALQQVSTKAKALARALGVRVVSIVSYDEYPAQDQPMYARSLGAEGIGGAAPQVESGSMDVSVNVSVVLEIK